MSTTSISQQEWSGQYTVLKRSISQRRQSGLSYPQAEVNDLSEKAEYLTKVLNSMSVSPMEFEISQSEIARRQVIMDNLRKQIVSVFIISDEINSSVYF
jgi:hypothetical protein